MNTKKYITLKVFCDTFGVCPTTAYDRLLNTGAIRAVRVGRRTLIDVESAEQFFASLPSFKMESENDKERKETTKRRAETPG